MDGPDALIEAILDEDSRLRDLLDRFPPGARDAPGGGGTLGPKETLAHLAFWDACAVRIFEGRLAGARGAPAAEELEAQNREELRRVCALPFAEVLRSYGEATLGLTRFLRDRWGDLKPKYRRDFWLPVRHRRGHRELLEGLLAVGPAAPRAREGTEG